MTEEFEAAMKKMDKEITEGIEGLDTLLGKVRNIGERIDALEARLIQEEEQYK